MSGAAKETKGGRRMPRLWKAMKDVASCDKPRGGAGNLRSADFRMGQPGRLEACHPCTSTGANPGN